jgi:superfamily II DNA or RNA helicase
MIDEYASFLATKSIVAQPVGFEASDLHPSLFPFQRDIVTWALRQGRCAIFADTGLGKTRMQLEWARQVSVRVGRVLILAPLAVAAQTAREGAMLGTPVALCREASDVAPGINVTNYDRLHRFDPAMFGAIVLDESSCIKHHDTKTLAQLMAAFGDTPYKLAATATPSPNDFAELGTHAEFLGICTRAEMLSEYFVHDASDTQTWRLKGHARAHFWRWVASWGALIRRPSDLGYEDAGYALPPLTVKHHVAPTDTETLRNMGVLFAEQARDLTERRNARKASIGKRVRMVADLVNADDEPWLVLGDFNAETEGVAKLVPDAVEVAGSDDPDDKAQAMLDFADGKIRVLVSKGSIVGWGMNFQRCARIAFVGVSDSWESYYQSVRRCYRFGQRRPVKVHIFSSEAEGSVIDNLKRKEADAKRMADELSAETCEALRSNILRRPRRHTLYEPSASIALPGWLRSANV